MNWEKERDALIAQTVEFVQSVTGRKPDFAVAPAQTVSPAHVVLPAEVITADPKASDAPEDSNIIVQPQPPAALTKVFAVDPAKLDGPPDTSLRGYELPKIDIRTDVRNRVAAFQAHQDRFHRDRDVYFRSALAKARAGAEDDHIARTDKDNR